MTLLDAQLGMEYRIRAIETDDEELDAVAGVFENMLGDVELTQ